MKINLYTTFYKDANQDRMNELLFCVNKNLSGVFDRVTFLVDSRDDKSDYYNLKNYEGCSIVIFNEKRPSFNDFFDSCEDYCINVISNTDIFFTENSIECIKHFFDTTDESLFGSTCLALSRWDYYPDGTSNHFDRLDSQDTWCFYGKPKIRTSIDFTMGVAGCDNRLAYELKEGGYNVLNPSKSLRTYHLHNSNVRNYIKDGIVQNRVEPPYYLVNPY